MMNTQSRHDNFISRQIGLFLYGLLVIGIFFLHNIEANYTQLDGNVDLAMTRTLGGEPDFGIATIIPPHKPDIETIDLALL